MGSDTQDWVLQRSVMRHDRKGGAARYREIKMRAKKKTAQE
jgi:hypothetical protein